MRLFTLSQSAGIYHQKRFCQKFAKSQSDLVVIVGDIPGAPMRPETSASEANARFPRQALLGRRPPILVRMATIPPCAGNRGALAPGRIPFVLEADLQGQEARRTTADIEGSSGIDLPNGR